MAFYNYGLHNPGEWVPINPVRVDDGYGNLIVNDPFHFSMALSFMKDNK